ncbi:hypothetical protein [Parabacteroides chongii]|uniref:hypothetical protein n=1 Tax=Parabacteroides chongii TaxID=2685834 RepID=UPI00240E8C4A|nr:hypothetical protein [Parabacteroides chongii]WFE85050.1 hypothetical protein P3L47_00110 [Parabacteroides chongii]
MNKAANLVANAILGDDLKVVILGSKAYTIQPPTIAVICKSIKYLSCIDRTTTGKEELSKSKGRPGEYAEGLSVFIFDDPEKYVAIQGATLKELKEALETVIKLISAEDFFVCAALAESVARMAAIQK